jgi:hypothetical protein
MTDSVSNVSKSNVIIQKLEKLYANITDLSSEKIQSVLQETLALTEALKQSIEQADPSEKEIIMKTAAELFQRLDGQVGQVCGSLNLQNKIHQNNDSVGPFIKKQRVVKNWVAV